MKKGKEDISVTSTSLPAGLIPVVEADFHIKYAQDNDILVMASDGVTDVLDKGERNEIFPLINSEESPKEQAEQILNRALIRSGGIATDDMTVCVCKIAKTH